MRVILVNPFKITEEQPLGLLYIASVIKRRNHEVYYFDFTNYMHKGRYRKDLIISSFVEYVKRINPDLIGFSVMTVNYNIVIALSREVRKFSKAKIIFGGIYPTIDPESIIREPSVDMVCIGEGELAIQELILKLETKDPIIDIENLWIKEGSDIYRNPLRPLVKNLDSLPFPYRGIINEKILKNENFGINFITSRGCPYLCTYCQNEYLQNCIIKKVILLDIERLNL